jgi:hypothetical protein
MRSVINHSVVQKLAHISIKSEHKNVGVYKLRTEYFKLLQLATSQHTALQHTANQSAATQTTECVTATQGVGLNGTNSDHIQISHFSCT